MKNEHFNGHIKSSLIDGNLKPALLKHLSSDHFYEKFDVKVVPASPGKASRLAPFLNKEKFTLYLNLVEAQNLSLSFPTAIAANELISHGVGKVIITNGQDKVSMASSSTGVLSVKPPRIKVKRLTGAGDAFLAAHIKAEMLNYDPEQCLEFAVEKSAKYISE